MALSYLHRWLWILLVIPLVGCVHVSAEMLVPPTKYSPVHPDSVRVFVAEGELDEADLEWESVAILFASGSADWTNQQGMLRKLRDEAGERGANGIILGEMKEPGFGERLFLGAGASRKSQVAAIRWWVRPPGVEVVARDLTAFLERVVTAQEAFLARHGTYAADPARLLVDAGEYVTLTIVSADSTGFGARAHDSRQPAVNCAVHVGTEAHRLFEGPDPGAVICERQ